MPELDIPQTGTTIASGTFGQPVVYRVVSRYASIAARDAETPSGAGETCYVQDIDEFQIWDGSAWVTYQPAEAVETQQVSIDLGEFLAKGEFLWTWKPSGAVSCSYSLRQEALNPTDAFTLPNAIPSALRPTSGFLYSFATSFLDGGTPQGEEQGLVEWSASGSVKLFPRANGAARDIYRGVISWVIGQGATVDPPV